MLTPWAVRQSDPPLVRGPVQNPVYKCQSSIFRVFLYKRAGVCVVWACARFSHSSFDRQTRLLPHVQCSLRFVFLVVVFPLLARNTLTLPGKRSSSRRVYLNRVKCGDPVVTYGPSQTLLLPARISKSCSMFLCNMQSCSAMLHGRESVLQAADSPVPNYERAMSKAPSALAAHWLQKRVLRPGKLGVVREQRGGGALCIICPFPSKNNLLCRKQSDPC